VSVLTRKPDVSEPTGLRGHAANAARQVGPIAGKAVPMAQQAAQQAVPLARQAGSTARHGADTAVAWATPLVDAARSWAAPQLEQSAHAVSDSIAPMISSALISAAHKIEVPQRKPRRRAGRLLAVSMLLTAAASAAMLVLRRRQSANGMSAGSPDGDSSKPSASEGPGFDINRSPDPDMNGNGSPQEG
jgi:hypothetical protein